MPLAQLRRRRILLGVTLAIVTSACAGLLEIQEPVVDPPDTGPDVGVDVDVADSTVDRAVPKDASADSACPALATFCDDFEIGDLRRWGDPQSTPPSTLTVDDAGPPHRGAYALHFATTQNVVDGAVVSSSAWVRTKPFAKVTSGTIAVRFYVRGPTVPSDNTTFVWLNKSNDSLAEAILYSSYGNWGAESVSGSLGAGTTATSKVPFATGRWSCVEWVVDVGTTGRQQLFIDGNAEPVLTKEMNTLGETTEGFEYASIYMNNQGPATQELYFDDVAVALLPTRAEGPRIGCIP